MPEINRPLHNLQRISFEDAIEHMQSQQVLVLVEPSSPAHDDRLSLEASNESSPATRSLHDIDFDKVIADLQLRGLAMRTSSKLEEAYSRLLKGF